MTFEVMVDDGEGGQRIERNPIVNPKPSGSGSTPAKGGGNGGGGGGKRSDSEKRKEKQQGLVKHTEAVVGRWVEKNKHRIPVVRFTNGRIKAIVPELACSSERWRRRRRKRRRRGRRLQ